MSHPTNIFGHSIDMDLSPPLYLARNARKTIEERDKTWEEDERLQDGGRRRAEGG